jgi:hypothetical protein
MKFFIAIYKWKVNALRHVIALSRDSENVSKKRKILKTNFVWKFLSGLEPSVCEAVFFSLPFQLVQRNQNHMMVTLTWHFLI